MRIPPKRNRIPRIHHWTRSGQDKPSQDTSHMGLDNTQENQGNPMLPRILQLLPTIYRSFQQDSQATIRKDRKEMHRQLGVGRQRTKGIRRTKDKTQYSASPGLLLPPCTNRDRDGRLEIRLLRNTISAMQGGEMEAIGIPIKNNVRRRMQLCVTILSSPGDTCSR